jgi:hypothetical protein
MGLAVVEVGLLKTIEYTILALAVAGLMRRQNATLPRIRSEAGSISATPPVDVKAG